MALMVIFFIFLPFFITDTYTINLFTEIVIIALLAIGFNLMMGYTGMVSLGHAAYFGVGAYTTAILIKNGLTAFTIIIPASIICAGLVALLLGIFCVRSKQAYFVFITLAFSQMVYIIIYYWDSLTGGDDGLPGIPRGKINFFGQAAIDLSSPIAFYYFCLVLVVLGVLFCRLVVMSPFGGMLQSIRENPVRVESLGINIFRYKLQIFTLSGALAGLSGSLFAVYQGFISPEILFWPKSAECILMTMLGGLQTFLGPGLGAFIMIFLKDTVLNYTEAWKIIVGGILIFIIMFTPKGVLGSLQEVMLRIKGQRS